MSRIRLLALALAILSFAGCQPPLPTAVDAAPNRGVTEVPPDTITRPDGYHGSGG